MSLLPLKLEGVGLERGRRTLLDGIELRIESGAPTLLLGPNGSGKSLLLRVVHGLVAPTVGRVRFATADPRAVRAAQAMVFQRPVLLRRSAAANVRYALAVRGVGRAARRRACARVLERTGLGPLAGQPARTLSGGEQQRLAIARAWGVEPELLLLDEPTANLDPSATRAVEELLTEIAAGGTKVVMATHDLAQARRLPAGDVVMLHAGRCVEHAAAASFFAAPRSPEARAFLAGQLSP